MKELILYWLFWTDTWASDEIQLDTLLESFCNSEIFKTEFSKIQDFLTLERLKLIFKIIRLWWFLRVFTQYKLIFIIMFIYGKVEALIC